MDSITQTITTIPGHTYTLDFWLQAHNAPLGLLDHFSVTWNGVGVYSTSGFGAQFGYTHKVFTNLTASSTSTSLVFSGGYTQGHFLLDDVNLVDNAPEPGSVGLLLAGCCALGFLRLRPR